MTAAVRKSYRSVPMCSPDTMISAAAHLEREWGSYGYRLGYVGEWADSTGQRWSIFQCCASDGSRFLIRANEYLGGWGFEASLEREVAAELDVEVS